MAADFLAFAGAILDVFELGAAGVPAGGFARFSGFTSRIAACHSARS
jgi:hypothetical protein